MTLVDLYRKVLEELRVVGAGDPADADDLALVSSRYPLIYQMLLSEDLVDWGPAAAVPDDAALPLIWLLAEVCAAPFGIDARLFQPQAQGAMPLLRRRLSKRYIAQPARVEYF